MNTARGLKPVLRSTLLFLGMDITKNLEYDFLVRKVCKRLLTPDSNCIDIGAYSGEASKIFARRASNGNHWAFEPSPILSEELKNKFSNTKVSVFQKALGNASKTTPYFHCENDLSFSSLRPRKSTCFTPDYKEIMVEQLTLDKAIPQDWHEKIDLIKISGGGAEYQILEGAESLLKSSNPYLLFSFDQDAPEYYQNGVQSLWNLLVKKHNYKLYSVRNWLHNHNELNFKDLDGIFHSNSEYVYIGVPNS